MSKGYTPRRFAPTLDPYVPTECSRAFGMLEFHMGAVRVHPKVPVRAVLLLVRMLFRPREGDWDSSVRVKPAEGKIQRLEDITTATMRVYSCMNNQRTTSPL